MPNDLDKRVRDKEARLKALLAAREEALAARDAELDKLLRVAEAELAALTLNPVQGGPPLPDDPTSINFLSEPQIFHAHEPLVDNLSKLVPDGPDKALILRILKLDPTYSWQDKKRRQLVDRKNYLEKKCEVLRKKFERDHGMAVHQEGILAGTIPYWIFKPKLSNLPWALAVVDDSHEIPGSKRGKGLRTTWYANQQEVETA